MSDSSEPISNMSETKIEGLTVTSLVRNRYSVRGFLPTPVPDNVLEECLHLAQRAASNSNIQPWRMTIATGKGLTRVSAALTEAVESGVESHVAPIPDRYKKYRSIMGHALYGHHGYNVARGDTKMMHDMRIRNYSFWGAPVAMILSVDKSLDQVDVLSAGLYLQTLEFLLRERGVTCTMSVSVARYPQVLKKELGIDEDMNILCGIAVGYEDPSQHVNGLRQDRDHWTEKVQFVRE